MKDPIAIELTHVKDKSGNPVIELSAPVLPFKLGQLIQAYIYNDHIIITSALKDTLK